MPVNVPAESQGLQSNDSDSAHIPLRHLGFAWIYLDRNGVEFAPGRLQSRLGAYLNGAVGSR